MTKQERWFIEERAVAFASLVLTKSRDVVVRSHAGHDIGVDLLVEVRKNGKQGLRFFGVQLVGYLDLPSTKDADERVLSHLEATLPLCVFVIGVRKPEGIYRWLVEPVVEGGRALLRRAQEPTWQSLDEAGAAHLIGQVNDWYDALGSDSPPKRHDKKATTEP